MDKTQICSNIVRQCRLERKWSQAELAERAGISRTAVSAIESARLVPSVATAIALAGVFDCTVEALFASTTSKIITPQWASPPRHESSRYWQAKVGNRIVRYVVEETPSQGLVHDGVYRNNSFQDRNKTDPNRTLVIASCDPAASLLAAEYSRATCFRLLVLPRSSSDALKLLGQGLIHGAGIHFATVSVPDGNQRAVVNQLGKGFQLLHVAEWQEGLAIAPEIGVASVNGAIKSASLRWIGREIGSAARQCHDEIRGNRPAPRRIARNHRAVADAIRFGWGDVGVCHRLVAEEAGLRFLAVRTERFDICFPTSASSDPRIEALTRLIRSPNCRRLFADLPGYETRHSGTLATVA
jgi:molybdate-binding protein/DNA-binding XRE family transcriptional regulator